MPELPEVESFRRYLEATSLQQKITQVEIKDSKIVKTTPEEITESIVNQSFIKTDRIGKYLFVELSSQKILLLHFGMTGYLEYFQDLALIPRFTRVLFSFANGFHLAFIDPRKFGRLELGNSVSEFKTKKKLAIDSLSISLGDFLPLFKKRKSPIKSVLLDQSVAAGVGNWIADEILFQAKIHPLRLANALNDKEIAEIYQKMKHILELAVAQEAYYRDFPRYFLIHSRGWTDEEPADCPHCANEIEQIRVGGRATYFCSKCQEK